MLDVTVVLLEGGYSSTAIGPIEVFHSAGVLWNWLKGDAVEPRFRVRTASIDGRPVHTLGGLALSPQLSIGDIERTDIVVLPASGWNMREQIAHDTPLLPWLRTMYYSGAYVAGVCSGVGFLAEAGLIDGREATTHWGVAELLRARYPKVHWRTDHFVTEDGRIFCSGGVYASIDISLYLVEKFCGHDVAVKCAKSLLLTMPRTHQTGYSVLPVSRPHSDERIRKVERQLRHQFHHPVSIESLAQRAAMSPRNFMRRFKAATGRSPSAYVQALRMSAAKELLESGALAIQNVCSQVGYEDPAAFRTVFKRHTGMTPAEYRARFAPMNFDRGELAVHQSGAPPCSS